MTDYLLTFDTTGSMFPCLAEVRRRVEEMVKKLFHFDPLANIAIMAHGDYCDARTSYVEQHTPFCGSNQIKYLLDFIETVGKTDGGDYAECYEYVLFTAKHLDWSSSERVMVMFADAYPHSMSDPQNTMHLSWMDEAKALAAKNVKICAVQCLANKTASAFWKDLAGLTGGYHLRLHQFENAVETILAITSKQSGRLEEYQEELELDARMNRGLAEIFASLGSTRAVETKYVAAVRDGLIPVPPTRFQVLTVPFTTDIKGFVLSTGANFQKGRGFYEFTKSELIQENKEVVLRDRNTGDLFSGEDARNMIGLPFGERGVVKPTFFNQYEVFIQSTSSNRKLIKNTKFLYEVEHL